MLNVRLRQISQERRGLNLMVVHRSIRISESHLRTITGRNTLRPTCISVRHRGNLMTGNGTRAGAKRHPGADGKESFVIGSLRPWLMSVVVIMLE